MIILDGWELLIVRLCYNRSQKPSLLFTPWESHLRNLRISLDPLFSYSLCLVSGHISDLALELSFSMTEFYYICEDKSNL